MNIKINKSIRLVVFEELKTVQHAMQKNLTALLSVCASTIKASTGWENWGK